jgi:hypothetical protein
MTEPTACATMVSVNLLLCLEAITLDTFEDGYKLRAALSSIVLQLAPSTQRGQLAIMDKLDTIA